MPIKLNAIKPEYPAWLIDRQGRAEYDVVMSRSSRNKVAFPVDRTKTEPSHLEALEAFIASGWLRLLDGNVRIEAYPDGPVDVYLVTEPALRWLRAIGAPMPVIGLHHDEAFTCCGAGQGAACCVYLSKGRDFLCGKTDPAIRREIDGRKSEMTASIVPTRDYPDCQVERVEMASGKTPPPPRRPPLPSRR